MGVLIFLRALLLKQYSPKCFIRKLNATPFQEETALLLSAKIKSSCLLQSTPFFFFFFFLPLITCEFLLVGSPYCPPFFSSAWRSSRDGGGKPVPFCLLEGYGGQLLWGRISALSRVLAPSCS